MDIDMMQAQLIRFGKNSLWSVFEARAENLPHWYLGELNGWCGIRKELKTVFRDSGRVISGAA
jgi:hypothetical protein